MADATARTWRPFVWGGTGALLLEKERSASGGGSGGVSGDSGTGGTSGGSPGSFDLRYYALSYKVGGFDPSEDGPGGHITMSARVSFYAE